MLKSKEKIKLPLLIPVALALAVLLCSSIAGVYWLGNKNVNYVATTRLNAVERLLSWQTKRSARIMHGLSDLILQDQNIGNAWQSQNRELLLETAEPLFRQLQDKYNLSSLSFYNTDLSCFLRAHQPLRNGDKVNNFSLAHAAIKKEPTEGIELDKDGTLTSTVVHPWVYKQKLLGYIELAEEIAHMTPVIKETLKADLLFTINKSNIVRKYWQEKQQTKMHRCKWELFNHFVISEHTMESIPEDLADFIRFTPTKYGQPVFKLDDGNQKLQGGFLTLKDTGGKSLGDIVVLIDVTDMQLSQMKMSAILAVFSLIVAVVLFILFFLHIHRIETKLAKRKKVEQTEIQQRQRTEEELKLAKNRAERTQLEIRQINKQLKLSVSRANKLAEKAIVADVAKGQFLANMSHEIRTPMNAIIGFSDILAEDNPTQLQQKYLSIVKESGKNLLQIINDILDFSKIEAGKMTVEKIECSLKKLIDNTELMMSPAANKKKLDFKTTSTKDLPAIIKTDPVRLQQCLINLVNNAIKFTEQGHVHLNVSLIRKKENPFIKLSIEDNGIGIPTEKLHSIFDAFIQADGDTTRKYGGTGLGLAITKNMINLLGGELSVESQEGKGSKFLILLPPGLDIENQPSIEEPCDITEKYNDDLVKYEDQEMSGTILVAEDTPTNQMLIRLLLEKLGFQVKTASNGKEAIDIISKNSFDLIFMDMHMPIMGGHEAVKEIRKMGITTPIVALTASVLKDDRNKCLETGCDDYLPKPINRKTLLEILRKHLSTQYAMSQE